MLRTRSGKTFGRTVTITNTMPGGDVNNLAPRQLAPYVAVPTVFTGNSGEDFEKWVKSFERVAKANDWPNGRLVNIMPAYISGRAGDLLDEVDAGLGRLRSLVVRALERYSKDPGSSPGGDACFSH